MSIVVPVVADAARVSGVQASGLNSVDVGDVDDVVVVVVVAGDGDDDDGDALRSIVDVQHHVLA